MLLSCFCHACLLENDVHIGKIPDFEPRMLVGANVNIRYKFKRSILMYASYEQAPGEILMMLLDAGDVESSISHMAI